MKVHGSITLDRVTEAVARWQHDLDNPGFCLACGEEQDGCEPDMIKGPCEHCGEKAVYGVAELLTRFGLTDLGTDTLD